MSMFNTGDILETIEMFTQDNLDVRTVTMGISLLDCIDPDPKKACENIYNKITTKAANLVSTVEHISAEYGIPIINKRISVTPIAMLLGACPDADPVDFAKTLHFLPYIQFQSFIAQFLSRHYFLCQCIRVRNDTQSLLPFLQAAKYFRAQNLIGCVFLPIFNRATE